MIFRILVLQIKAHRNFLETFKFVKNINKLQDFVFCKGAAPWLGLIVFLEKFYITLRNEFGAFQFECSFQEIL